MSLPRIAVRRPVTMSMISISIVLIGIVALSRLPVDLMPDVTFPSLTVTVSYPDVGPLEMEELVTRPLEQTVAAIAGLEEVVSTSQEGTSQIRLNFGWGTDLSEAADDLRSRLDRMRGRLPEDAEPPVIFKFDAANAPIMFLGLEGDLEPVALREMAENDLSPRLERVPGVATVTVRGGLRRQIRVELAKDKITALDLAVNEIIDLLRTENQNVPIGELDDGDMTYLLRSPGQFASLEDIRNVVVMTRGGVPVYMRDIAEVTDGTEDQEELVRINGRTAVQMMISKQSGRNTVGVARAVRTEIDRINTEMPGVRLTTRMDSAIFVERSINAVRNVVLWGAMLVVVVLFAFLRNVPDAHHLHRHPDLDHRHVRAGLLRRLHPQHADVRRAGSRRRHDRGRLDRRAREHVPAHGGRQGSHHRQRGRGRGGQRGHRRVDPDAGGGLPAVALLDRGLEHRLRPVGGRGDDRARDVAVRGRDPGAGDDVTAAAAAAAAGSAAGRLRPVPDPQ